MKKPSASSHSVQQYIARAKRGLRETPDGGLILDESSLEEDFYADIKEPLVEKQKKQKRKIGAGAT